MVPQRPPQQEPTEGSGLKASWDLVTRLIIRVARLIVIEKILLKVTPIKVPKT